MNFTLKSCLALILLLALSGIGFAEESTAASSDSGTNENKIKTELAQSNKTITNEIPYKKEEGYSGASIVRILFSFVFVVLIIFAVVFVLRKYYYGKMPLPKGDSKNINLIETKRLSPKMVVFLLDVQGDKVLLAQCGDNIAFYPANESSLSVTTGDLKK